MPTYGIDFWNFMATSIFQPPATFQHTCSVRQESQGTEPLAQPVYTVLTHLPIHKIPPDRLTNRWSTGRIQNNYNRTCWSPLSAILPLVMSNKPAWNINRLTPTFWVFKSKTKRSWRKWKACNFCTSWKIRRWSSMVSQILRQYYFTTSNMAA